VCGAGEGCVNGTCVTLCGNGTLDPGEQCDDNNTQDGDCCSSTCQYEQSGSPCADDGDSCTADTCDGAGTCTHPVVVESKPCNTCNDNLDNDSDGRIDLEDTNCATLGLLQRFALLAAADDRSDLHLGWSPQVVGTAGSDPNALACQRCVAPGCDAPTVQPYPAGRSCAAVCANGYVKVKPQPEGHGYVEGDLVVDSDEAQPSEARPNPFLLGQTTVGGKLVTAGSAPLLKHEQYRVEVGPPMFCTDGVTQCCEDAGCGGELCEVRKALDASDPAAHECVDMSGGAAELMECRGAIAAAAPNGSINQLLTGLVPNQSVPSADLTNGCLRLGKKQQYEIDIEAGAQVVVEIPCLKMGIESVLRLVGQADQVVVVKVPGMFKTGYGAVIEVVGLRAENLLWALVGEGSGNINFGSTTKGTFWAPERRIKLGLGTNLEGAIIAERINTKFDATLTHVPFTALVE
jgi:cysteine-rich repeat protein